MGRATLVVTHTVLPKGTTLDMYNRDMNAMEATAGVWTEFRPEPPTHMQVDGHDAIAWRATKSANGMTLKTFEVAVLLRPRFMYDFVLQASAADFSSAFEDVNQMLRSVKFRK